MNFASRVKVPVLMINGRYDFEIPLETCQQPLFRWLGGAASRISGMSCSIRDTLLLNYP